MRLGHGVRDMAVGLEIYSITEIELHELQQHFCFEVSLLFPVIGSEFCIGAFLFVGLDVVWRNGSRMNHFRCLTLLLKVQELRSCYKCRA